MAQNVVSIDADVKDSNTNRIASKEVKIIDVIGRQITCPWQMSGTQCELSVSQVAQHSNAHSAKYLLHAHLIKKTSGVSVL